MLHSIPIKLQHLIEEKLGLVRGDSLHQLRPYFRNQIYDLMRSEDSLIGNESVIWLQILAAQHVLSIGRSILPKDYNPELLIQTAKDILSDKVSLDFAETQLDRAWKIQVGVKLEGAPQIYLNAHNAFEASLQALAWAIEIPHYLEFDENETDWDWLDPSSDAAIWAAASYAGSVWDTAYNLIKGKEFWEWWLTEAIPQAWNLAHDQNRSS